MSKAVLISIRPKWCELIASGKKTIEVRKTRPKLETPFKCYMYMSKYHWAFDLLQKYGMEDLADRLMHETGMVMGEFVCDGIQKLTYRDDGEHQHYQWLNAPVWALFLEHSACLTHEQIKTYLLGKTGHGWHISNLVIYDEPKKLTDFIRPSGGCCNEGMCAGCIFLDEGNGYNVEDDCMADFDTDRYSIVTRPPQSWCYVREIES